MNAYLLALGFMTLELRSTGMGPVAAILQTLPESPWASAALLHPQLHLHLSSSDGLLICPPFLH